MTDDTAILIPQGISTKATQLLIEFENSIRKIVKNDRITSSNNPDKNFLESDVTLGHFPIKSEIFYELLAEQPKDVKKAGEWREDIESGTFDAENFRNIKIADYLNVIEPKTAEYVRNVLIFLAKYLLRSDQQIQSKRRNLMTTSGSTPVLSLAKGTLKTVKPSSEPDSLTNSVDNSNMDDSNNNNNQLQSLETELSIDEMSEIQQYQLHQKFNLQMIEYNNNLSVNISDSITQVQLQLKSEFDSKLDVLQQNIGDMQRNITFQNQEMLRQMTEMNNKNAAENQRSHGRSQGTGSV